MRVPSPANLPPEFLARYEVLGILGEGGVGFVLEVRDRKLDRRAAAKFLHEGFAGDPQMLARFRREARLTAALAHPAIVRVYDLGVAGDSPYIVYELVEGPTLREILDASPPGLTQALRLVSSVLDGLHAAHQAGVVHRDLKPENLLLASDGSPRIADFGIARSLSGQTLDTSKGFILGTPGYLAPEVLRGEEATPAADLYAAGAILFELIYGRQPFLAPSLPELLQTVLAGPPELPSQPPIPTALAALLSSALAQQPGQRPSSAGSFASALRAIAESLSASGQPQAQTLQVKLPRSTRPSSSVRGEDGSPPQRWQGATQMSAVAEGPPEPSRPAWPSGPLAALLGVACGLAGVWFWSRPGAIPTPSGAPLPVTPASVASTAPPVWRLLEVRRGGRDLGLTWTSASPCRTAVRLRAVGAAASVLEQSSPGPETTEHRQTLQRLDPGTAYLLEPLVARSSGAPASSSTPCQWSPAARRRCCARSPSPRWTGAAPWRETGLRWVGPSTVRSPAGFSRPTTGA
jgi:serine/threonine protein kinase